MELGNRFSEIASESFPENLSHKFESHESERPTETELPELRKEDLSEQAMGRWDISDSERESIELPELKNFGAEKFSADIHNDKNADVAERPKPIQNKIDGLNREHEVRGELEKKYPESEGYTVIGEACLRDENGEIVKDPETEEKRRIDFVVLDRNGDVIDSVEVTSKTADKTKQMEKEERIRDIGGNYIRDENRVLHKIPATIHTRIERRE